MQDPALTIYTALKTDWALSGDLAKENLRFSTGLFDEKYENLQVTVTEFMDRDEPFELGYGTVRVFAIYMVDIWVKYVKTTGKGPGKAKDYLWDMREEVKRILKSHLTGLTDIQELVLNDVGRRLDEPERHLLRFNKLVTVIYDIT